MRRDSRDGLIEVRSLRPDEIPEAIGVLARGMRDNPLHVVAYGSDPDRRRRCHATLMNAAFQVLTDRQPLCATRNGVIVGVTGVAPVGRCQPTLSQRVRLLPRLAALGPRSAALVSSWMKAWAELDLAEPHVHIGPLAVDADVQGGGVGSMIMLEHCRRLDEARDVGYLETDKLDNVAFYRKFGYETTAEATVIGVRNWFMRRSPAG